jgi:hypothetical protein
MPRVAWIAETAGAVAATVKAIATATAATARPRARPDLRELERQARRDAEQAWEDGINAGTDPPGWLPRRRGWLTGRWTHRRLR